MFEYAVQQNRWVIIALGIGIVLTIAVVLGFMAAWARRYKIPSDDPHTTGERIPTIYAIPWILTALYVGIILYAVLYVTNAIRHPPNW